MENERNKPENVDVVHTGSFKKVEGITLIALVITIIVLLILAGVTIASLSGENGILTRASDSKEKTEIAEIKEEIQRKILEEQVANEGQISETTLESILLSKGTLSDETNILDRTLTTTKGNYEIPVRDVWNGTLSGSTGTGSGGETGSGGGSGTGSGGETGTGSGGETGSGGGSGTGSSITDTADTKPATAMPSEVTVIEADPSKGIVIKDSKNNEWVWIEVPKSIYSNATYTVANSGNSVTSSADYKGIYNILNEYAKTYRKGKADQWYYWTDEWYDGCGIADSGTYTTMYQKMLTSVYTNGGFWIGRYEAGVSDTTPRTAEGEITGLEAKSQPDMYPFNYVTCSQAQTLASAMSTDSNKTSSLMFGIQWDLVCKYLEGKDGLTTADINSDSINWGNYSDIEVPITSVNAKQRASDDTWSAITGIKAQDSKIMLSTGASNNTKKMNIYDFAGNEVEWTLERATYSTSRPCAGRGGGYYGYGSNSPASTRIYYKPSDSDIGSVSFRPSLY